MTPTQFAEALALVINTSVDGRLGELAEPHPKSAAWELRASRFYVALDHEGRERVDELVRRVAWNALRNFLSVLDGNMAIEPSGPKGRLELHFLKGEEKTLLNDYDITSLDTEFAHAVGYWDEPAPEQD